MRKKRFLFVDMYPNSMTFKLLFFLKNYFDITLIILQSRKNNDTLLENYNNLGIKVYFFDVKSKKEVFKLLLRLFFERLRRYDFVLGKAGPNWPAFLTFKIFNSSKKIYFPYDVFLFLWKNQKIRSKLGRMFEKSNLKNADFIIHKGPENQFDLVKKNEVKEIKAKKIQFISCFDDWIIPIKENRQKKISLVYIGICPDNEPSIRIPFSELFEKISKSKLDLHIFAIKADKKHSFKKVNKKNIIYHPPLSNKALNEEISNYHYGISLGFMNRKIVDDRFLKTTIGNKILSYLEAGIPVIVNDEVEFIADFIKKFNCGIVISEKDVTNLEKILKNQRYEELLKGVEKARKSLIMSKEIRKMVEVLNS